MDRINKVTSGLYPGIAIALFFILQKGLTQPALTAKQIVTTVAWGLFWGALAGLLMGWLRRLSASAKRVSQEARISLDTNETLVFESSARHFRGSKETAGKLYLTSQRLVFKSYKSPAQNHELSICLSHIGKVYRCKTFGITDNGFAVSTTDSKVARFAVQRPDQWFSQLTEKQGLPFVQV